MFEKYKIKKLVFNQANVMDRLFFRGGKSVVLKRVVISQGTSRELNSLGKPRTFVCQVGWVLKE